MNLFKAMMKQDWANRRSAIIVVLALGMGVMVFLVASAVMHSKTEVAIRADLVQILDLATDKLNAQINQGQAMGVAMLLGLNEPVLKDVALGKTPAVNLAHDRLRVPRLQLGADGAYVIDRSGNIVAHETNGKSQVGANVTFRPYFQRAMQGLPSVYAAVGIVSDERGVFFAAPLRRTEQANSDVIGVLMIKMPTYFIEKILHNMGVPALLVSPYGVVFASTHSQWQFKMNPPASLDRVVKIRQLKQFGRRFEKDEPEVLGFDSSASSAIIDKRSYVLERQYLDFNDPAGAWELVAMNTSDSLTPAQRQAQIGLALGLLIGSLLLGIVAVVIDAYRRRIALVRRRLLVLGKALQSGSTAVVLANPDGKIEWVNTLYEIHTGYILAQARGRALIDLIGGDALESDVIVSLRESLAQLQPWRGEVLLQHRNGSQFWLQVLITPVIDEQQKLIGYVGLQDDVSPRKKMEAELREMAHFDTLTGLPNRALFLDRLQRAAVTARRARSQFALLFIDLDGFKAVNDQHGHDAGDAVLRSVANSLRQCVRESDTVARMGGDEFTVVLNGLVDRGTAAIVAQKIISTISLPIEVGAISCHIGASIGIGIFPDDGDDTNALLALADSAMYQVKRSGKNAFRFFADV